MTLTSGSLFAGYGGLGMAVEQALGAQTAWVSDVDPGANKILAHRFPGVPNLGDITTVDWAQVQQVDVIEGGSPCQDVSAAGKRAGMRAGTRSGLWASMCDAVDIIRPSLVVWENVRGVLSAGADSDLEPCPICVGDERECNLRALGRVAGDLSELGYDTAWCGLRAADVGAPHGRYRVFVLGWPAADTDSATSDQWRLAAPGQAESGRAWADAGGRSGAHAADPHGPGLEVGAGVPGHDGKERQAALGDGRDRPTTWDDYAPAIARWEAVLGRVAPSPTSPSAKGNQRLSAHFVEFLMGLPEGWVTDVPGLSRNDQLKALGNGVVPQQGAAAITYLLQFVPASVLAGLFREDAA